MTNVNVDPVAKLREYAEALEAAMTLVLAEPEISAVHKLRSMTRRLEAQVALLGQLEALSVDSLEAKKLRKRVKKLRRAAGEVRDLDVLRGMLEDEPLLPQRGVAKLRGKLEYKRERKAAKLQGILLEHLPRVVAALEQVVHSVGTANGMTVPAISLVPIIEKWRRAQADGVRPSADDDEHLHSTRKVAKTARYMAEAIPESTEARAAAARYEAQQDAGGRWHDWLQLAAVAEKHLGKGHALVAAAAEQTEVARAEFLQVLG